MPVAERRVEVVLPSPGSESADAGLGSDRRHLGTDSDAGFSPAVIVEPATEPPGIHRFPGVFAAR